jgi:hypothetical protein
MDYNHRHGTEIPCHPSPNRKQRKAANIKFASLRYGLDMITEHEAEAAAHGYTYLEELKEQGT